MPKKGKKPVQQEDKEIKDINLNKDSAKTNQKLKSSFAKRKAEEARKAKEAELRLQEQRETHLLIKRELKLLKEKMKQNIKTHEIRVQKLKNSCLILEKFSKQARISKSDAIAIKKWEAYLRCDDLPDPLDIKDANLFIYKWQNEPEPKTLQDLVPKFHKVLGIVDEYNDYIRQPLSETSTAVSLDAFKLIRSRLFVEMFNKINKLSYYIMQNVKSNSTPVGVFYGNFCVDTEHIALGFYSRTNVTKCIGEDDNDIELPIIAEFPELNVSIDVPYQLMYEKYVVRVVKKKYDDFSLMSNSMEPIPMPYEYSKSMVQFVEDEYIENLKLCREYKEALQIKKQRNSVSLEKKQASGSKKKIITEKLTYNLPENNLEHKLSHESHLSSIRSYLDLKSNNDLKHIESGDLNELRSPSKTMLLKEEEKLSLLATYLKQNVKIKKTVLNLREYTVLGGIYHVDFLEAIPQPKTLMNLSKIYVSEEGQSIKPISFSMNTTQVIRKVYNKYRHRFGQYPIKKKEAHRLTHDEVESFEQKQRIEASLNRISIDVDKRLSQFGKKRSKLGSKVVTDTRSTEIRKPLSIGSSISSSLSKSSISSEPLSIDSIIYDDFERTSTCKKVEEDNMSVSSTDSEDSFKSHDSMFDEYEIKTYEPEYFRPKMTISLPKDVLFFEKPFPVIWNSRKKWWSYNDRVIFKIQYKEKENGEVESVSFRYSKLEAPIALAVLRYAPLPFTNWKLWPGASKRSVDNSIFYLETELVTMEFDIKLDKVSLKHIDIRLPHQNKHVMDDHIGKYYDLTLLISKMRNVGLDVFPDNDAYLYINKKCFSKKHEVLENHTYKCMAMACSSHSFSWSNWNHMTSRKKIVMNVKENISNCPFQIKPSLCVIKPQEAVILGDENELEFHYEHNTSYADLYGLLQDNSCTVNKYRMKNCNKLLADTVYQMLCRTLVHSYS